MSGQMVIVVLLVGAAVAYLGWTAWRTVAGRRAGCGSGCGKCATPVEQPGAKGRIALPQV